ncbi:MAG: hypothetical protein KAR33_02490, partial [Candidatus Thorarchaeota archaeon]|nr:hypothetical protein [Candidatus Thorarchaeota archaeon]
SIAFEKESYDYSTALVKLLVNPIPTILSGVLDPVVPVGDDFTQAFSFYDSLNQKWLIGAIATVYWDLDINTLEDSGNGTYYFIPEEIGYETLDVGEYLLRVVFTMPNYARGQIEVILTIRPIETELRFTTPSESAFAGDEVTLTVVYWDIDHNVPIINAENSTEGTNAQLLDAINSGDGTYIFVYNLYQVDRFEINIVMSSNDYDAAALRVVIYAIATEEQIMVQNAFSWGTAGLLLLSLGIAAWLRHFSIPKMLRWIRAMIKSLQKGRVPTPPPVRSRREMLHEWINEELESVNIIKPIEDISEYSFVVDALDTDALLEELAVVVGLTESDIVVLRRDLDKMRPSERAGFLSEVIKQERARRAQELADIEVPEEVIAEAAAAQLSEDELVNLKERFLELGIAETEADLMVEQARSLTRAEIDALLDQIGGMKE